ncbi:DUF2852 domain-containing protein [Rhodobaculum claviforme]|uniref:DUF2852 domain-containing protein n=1 Tax=Rhodobaculum claviforme TaxID=1549854 RepID=A0A934TKK1_9RHOB|nr:DUF2852 domain-containing protein [Rhodobaculum claviforme]MBK5927490.1 hypothetical protein [Rhodobaculum claviforme]
MTAITTWPSRAEMWLDDHGRGAWIAAMVLGFIFFWPAGLAILFYMIWGKKMFGTKSIARTGLHGTSGNSAFDAYKADTLKRLEDEQQAFDDFLRRLREAKDKTEFDAFMDERARRRREDASGRD